MLRSRAQLSKQGALITVVVGILLGCAIKRSLVSWQNASTPWILRLGYSVLSSPLTVLIYFKYIGLYIFAILFFLSYLANYARRSQRAYTSYRNCQPPLHATLAFPITEENHFTTTIMTHPQPFVFPKSEVLESACNEFINLLLLKHIHRWYGHISQRPLFSVIIERLIRLAAINTKTRLEEIDVVALLIRKTIPIFTQHLQDYAAAEARVKKLGSLPGGCDLEQDAIAQHYRGGSLHRSARIGKSPDASSAEDAMQSYLRQLVTKLLPVLLPAQEIGSPLVATLLREILACAVLAPLIQLLSEPDFWNQMLVTHAHQAIQERARVKRFRHVLKEQSRNPLTQKRQIKKKPMRHLERLMVTNDPKQWDRLYRRIKKSQSPSDISRMRKEIMLLKTEMLASELESKSENTLMRKAPTAHKDDHYVIKAMTLLERKLAALSKSNSNGFIADSDHSLSFDRTLAIGVSYFLEFLERRHRVELLDYWHQVMAIKLSTCEAVPDSQLSVLDSEVHLSKAEISKLYNRFFRSALLIISQEETTLVGNYLEHEQDVYDFDSNEVIINVARRAYQTMEIEDFPVFKNDPLYFNMVTSEIQLIRAPLIRVASTVSVEGLNQMETTDNSDFEDFQKDTPGTIQDGDSDFLAALEYALQDIRDSPTSSDGVLASRRSIESDRSTGDERIMATDLLSAEPGDLEIAERIAQLDIEIREKTQSLKIIDQYTITKTNIDEIEQRVISKSRSQLVAELELKSNQRRVYELQNDEHDLYSRSAVKIDSTTTQRDADGEYVVYMVEVNRRNLDGTQAGWIVARRYSEFNELQSRLKSRFPVVATFEFPKKQLNRLKSVSETRRPILESFLRHLLSNQGICKSFEFRSFLSQHNEHVSKKRHKSVMENLMNLTDPRETLAKFFALVDSPEGVLKPENPDLRDIHPPPIDQSDDDVSSFAKPIVDLILEAFDLRERSKWIRKRAVVLILQQFLGGTIESRLRDGFAGLIEERALVNLIVKLGDSLASTVVDSDADPSKSTRNQSSAAPRGAARGDQDGRVGQSGMMDERGEGKRTKLEKQRLRELAQETLRAYKPPYVPDGAGKKIFRVFQNQTLNVHLLGRILDTLTEAIFERV